MSDRGVRFIRVTIWSDDPYFAEESAISLPIMLTWPGTQMSITVFKKSFKLMKRKEFNWQKIRAQTLIRQQNPTVICNCYEWL